MNRATAETQKLSSDEEGFEPILAWVKALVDDVLASEFGAPGLEFAWSPGATVDPAAQEQVLSSYTSRGILTINEARAMLGRDPLTDPAADRPMALTGTGYVALGDAATKLDKDGAWDEGRHPRWPAGSGDGQGGRFAPTGGAGSPASPPQAAALNAPAGHRRVATVVPICTKGSHSESLIDGIMHYWAEYNCLDGSTIERRSIGIGLEGFIPQPR